MGESGAGMYLVTTIQPTAVSFAGLAFSEGFATAEPAGPDHNPAGGSGEGQAVDPNARSRVGVWPDNREISYDHCYIGPIELSSQPFPTPAYFDPDFPNLLNSFTWNIPVSYKLADPDDMSLGIPIQFVRQTMTFNQQIGFAEVTQSGQDVKRIPNQ
jgi:hypothetical protein